MTDFDDELWDLYWESRLIPLQNLGKQSAILAASRLIRQRTRDDLPVRLLELGCGEGQIIGNLHEAHSGARAIADSLGVDYLPRAIQRCRRDYPHLHWLEGDFTDPGLHARIGPCDILLLVNALHEVFSSTYSLELGEVDVPAAKNRVEQTLAAALAHLTPGGYLVLFDGLESPGDPRTPIQIRFRHPLARQHFETFAREYVPFRIRYQPAGRPDSVVLSQHHFTRYITKLIFLGKPLWQTEQLESYQYFTEAEFRGAIQRAGLRLIELQTLTVDEDRWQKDVEILTPGADFPTEHIQIIAQKAE